MNKVILWLVAIFLVVGAIAIAEAQQPTKVPRVGVFLPASAPATAHLVEAFRQGLRERGYIGTQNVTLELRYAEGKVERLASIATELVRLKVDVMVASLAHPGGNITGVTALGQELGGKRLEVLKEAVPKVSRVAVLSNPENPDSGLSLKGIEVAAQALAVQLRVQNVRDPTEFEKAFESINREGATALMVLPDPMFVSQRGQIVALSAKSRLPAMYAHMEFMDAGGLMFYGAGLADMWWRAATYVDKILKGAKPANLPVEQPKKFELVINLKTAQQIGLTIPPNVLARADRVIK